MTIARMLPIVILTTFVAGCDKSDENAGGSGFIETDEVIVSAEVRGRVLNMFVSEGSRVEIGDTLATIDTTRLVLQLKSIEATRATARANLYTAKVQLDQAQETEAFSKVEFDRVTKLLSSGTASQKLYDQAQHEHTQAKLATQRAEANILAIQAEIDKTNAEIARTRRELEDCHPLATVSGVVTGDYVDPGELANAGSPMIKIARLDTVWVKVYLNAADFAGVKLGDNATIDTETGGSTYTGYVVWTSEEAEFTPKNVQTEESRSGLVYAVKVRIPNLDQLLKVGMPVFVKLKDS